MFQQTLQRIPPKNESNCNICDRKFHTAYILKKHIGNVHTIEKCNVCDKGVAKGKLARHMKTHIESKFECEKCKNVYTRKDSLQKHQLNCGGDIVKIRKPAVMIFSCETCGKTFTQKRYLTQHKRTHRMDMGKFDCKLCDKIYTSNQKLGKHIEKHHPNPRRVENAAIGFLVLESSPPRNHMAQNPKKIYSCKQCNYVNTHKGHLKRHIDTHTSKEGSTLRHTNDQFIEACHAKVKKFFENHPNYNHKDKSSEKYGEAILAAIVQFNSNNLGSV